MRKKVKIESMFQLESAISHNCMVYYKDQLHRVQKDLFGKISIVSLNKEEPCMLFADEQISDCLMLIKR